MRSEWLKIVLLVFTVTTASCAAASLLAVPDGSSNLLQPCHGPGTQSPQSAVTSKRVLNVAIAIRDSNYTLDLSVPNLLTISRSVTFESFTLPIEEKDQVVIKLTGKTSVYMETSWKSDPGVIVLTVVYG